MRAVSLDPCCRVPCAAPLRLVALQTIDSFQVRNADAAKQFEQMYTASKDPMIQTAGRETFEAVAMLQAIQRQQYTPAAGADYPRGRLGTSLQQIAHLIKSDVGVEMAFADIGGWDHHVNETLLLGNLLTEYGQALTAFWKDMGDRMNDVVLVTMSEFGRTAHENGNRGTDHGHANSMFVMGGGVKGGKVYGKWPGLQKEQLYEGRDPGSHDRLPRRPRRIPGGAGHLGNPSVKNVFPGYSPKFLGLV